jgi:hypothetical protein
MTIGVDLASTAFVRLHHPEPRSHASAPRFGDVAVGRVDAANEDRSFNDPVPGLVTAPDSVHLGASMKTVGRMRNRQLDRLLSPLQLPAGSPLFGCEGPAIPMWALASTPSVSLVEPEDDISIVTGRAGVVARFRWRGYTYELPIDDRRLLARLDWLPEQPVKGRSLAELIGFFPSRALLALGEPQQGYCYKSVAALLP